MTDILHIESEAMMPTVIQSALIVGGSRGAGRDLAILLGKKGVQTHVVARGSDDLTKISTTHPDINVISRDAAERGAAEDLLITLRPDLLVLTAGATPKMVPFHQMDWTEFSAAWETDVKIAHSFLTAALTLPLKPGSTIASFSSGAGLGGSRLSGGYAGAKRMQHFLTDYARTEAEQRNLDLRLISIIPKQLVTGTEKGQAAATAYAAATGVTLDAFWSNWDAPLTSAGLASHVAEILFEPDQWPGNTYTITGGGAVEAG